MSELREKATPFQSANSLEHGADRSFHGPTRRQLVLLTTTFWLAEFLLSELRSVVDHSVRIELYTGLRLVSAVVGALEFWGIHLLATEAARRGWRHRGMLVVATAVLAGMANLKAVDWLQNLTDYPVSDYGPGWRIYKLSYWAMLFGAWAAIYLALGSNREAVRQERQAHRLADLARDAQLRALRFQVDPHFLFNTFNSVAALLMEHRASEAEEMIEQAAEYFRSTLTTDPRLDVPLRDELRLQQLYLAIEKVRFPDLEVEFDVHPEAENLSIPSLLLHPLLENAVKFARGGADGSVRIGISVPRPQKDVAQIEVWDEGGGKSASSKGTGTGLNNVRERLRGRFGPTARLDLVSRDPNGARVILTFPIDRASIAALRPHRADS